MVSKASVQNALYPLGTLVVGLAVWQLVVVWAQVPSYLVPSPWAIAQTLVTDAPAITSHTLVTLLESLVGFSLSVVTGFLLAVVMDRSALVKKCLYPILIISQTVPIIALTPLLIIWFGFGMLTKVLVILLVCFFPIAISLADGFDQVDRDQLNLFRTLKATRWQVFWHLKLPASLVNFLSGLKIAVTYTLMAAVIGEWMGGTDGIGVYMVRAKKAYALDKVFASIVVIVVVSLVAIALVNRLTRRVTHWK